MAVYTSDPGIFSPSFTPLDHRILFKQAHFCSDVVIHYARPVLCVGK